MPLDRGPVVFTDFIEANGRHLARRTAVQAGSTSRTWGEFHERTNRLANYLRNIGLQRGDRIGLVVRPDVAFVELSIAALKAAISVAPLSPMMTKDVLVRLAQNANIKALAVSPSYIDFGNALQVELAFPKSNCLISGEGGGDFTSIEQAIACSGSEPLSSPSPDDEFNIIYSSGTTGIPKGIVHSHYTRLMHLLGYAHRYMIRHDSTMLLSTTSATNGTWVNMLPTLMAGGRLILMPKFDAADMLAIMESERVTHAFLVPTQVKAILEAPELGQHELAPLKVLITGGSKFPVSLKRELMQKLPGRLHELYGTTEGGSTTLYPADLPEKIASVGRPVPGTEFRVVGEDGSELPDGMVGEIVLRGVSIMKGYLHRPEADAEMEWRDARGRLFIRTGDVGRIDEDGYVYIMDRQRDMIITGGINVFATDIEDVVRQHEAVAEVGVIAVPHDKWGETPVAIVILKDGTTATADDILAFSNARLGKVQRINAVVLRTEPFPRNDLGKLVKRQIRDEFLSGRDTKRN